MLFTHHLIFSVNFWPSGVLVCRRFSHTSQRAIAHILRKLIQLDGDVMTKVWWLSVWYMRNGFAVVVSESEYESQVGNAWRALFDDSVQLRLLYADAVYNQARLSQIIVYRTWRSTIYCIECKYMFVLIWDRTADVCVQHTRHSIQFSMLSVVEQTEHSNRAPHISTNIARRSL